MGDHDHAQSVVLNYRQPEHPFETRTQRVFQGLFVALVLVYGLLCVFDGFRLGGAVFLGMGGFFAGVMFFPVYYVRARN